MTSEEIIQRLLDQKKITTKEALIILKDLAKIGISQTFGTVTKEPLTNTVMTMYGIPSPINLNSTIQ